jgi:hypothetical protein
MLLSEATLEYNRTAADRLTSATRLQESEHYKQRIEKRRQHTLETMHQKRAI